jgi:copper chaperone
MKTVKIKGMSCQHCVNAVTRALSEIDGVSNVQVNLSAGEATFEEARPVTADVVAEKIKKAGFEIG